MDMHESIVPEYRLSYRHLFEFQASVAPEISIQRRSADARLSICYFTRGTFQGKGIRGVLLPGGGDWASVVDTSRLQIDVRGALQTDDGALIYMKYRGLWLAAPGLLARVIERAVPYVHENHYLRVTAEFETDAKAYGHLNDIVAVGVGGYAVGGVHYSFYAIE
jgi:Protein of unknown function (DUF3237)